MTAILMIVAGAAVYLFVGLVVAGVIARLAWRDPSHYLNYQNQKDRYYTAREAREALDKRRNEIVGWSISAVLVWPAAVTAAIVVGFGWCLGIGMWRLMRMLLSPPQYREALTHLEPGTQR